MEEVEEFLEFNPHDMPETTALEIINKIAALAWDIRNDWSDAEQLLD